MSYKKWNFYLMIRGLREKGRADKIADTPCVNVES